MNSRPWVPAKSRPSRRPSNLISVSRSRPLTMATVILSGWRASSAIASLARGIGTAFHRSLVSSEMVPSKSRHSSGCVFANRSAISLGGSGAGMLTGSDVGGGLRLNPELRCERSEKVRRPSLQVVAADLFAQRVHPFGANLGAHFERFLQSIGDGVGVVRIHQQRLGPLFGGAGELTQDQDRIIIRMRRDEFLGD